MYRTRATDTPTVAAASGCSPTARTLSPNGVRYISHATTGNATSPSGISGLWRSPATSAVVLVPAENPATLGEFDELSNTSLRKYRVSPTASRLIAIPDTT